MKKVIHSIVQAAMLLLIMTSPFAWLMRDGLGPDATTSYGFDAISKFFITFYWGPAFLGLAILSALIRCAWRTQDK